MLNPLTWFTGGWQGYVIAALVSAILSGYAISLPYRLTIADMERDRLASQANAYATTLDEFKKDAALIHQSASDYTDFKQDLQQKFAAAAKDLKHAIKARPLPDGCGPDIVRVRALEAAIAATNTAAGSKPLPAVPVHP